MTWFILFLTVSVFLGSRLPANRPVSDRAGLLLVLAFFLAAAYFFLPRTW